MKEDSSHIPASVWRRISGVFIDSIIVALGTYSIGMVINVNNQILVSVLNIIIGMGYWIGMTYKTRGQTVGKYINKTRVVSLVGELTLKKIVVRFVILDLFFIIPYLVTKNEIVSSWITILLSVVMLGTMIRDKKHRGIHDLIAGTWVRKELS